MWDDLLCPDLNYERRDGVVRSPERGWVLFPDHKKPMIVALRHGAEQRGW
jgi:hypothetical protein